MEVNKEEWEKTLEDSASRGVVRYDYASLVRLIRDLREEARQEERLSADREHLKEINRVLNLHSKSVNEGGLDYVKAFEEMERYEHRLMRQLSNERV